jgi:GntR family carbon starvation induced transcriptional regulator
MAVSETTTNFRSSSDRSRGERGPSLSEQAFRTLRRRILSGDIAPGQRLRMEMLQKDHNFSSSPLREALNRLAAEGLVIADDHRGFRAAPLSSEDLQDITKVRLVIEIETLSLSMAHGDDRWEGAIYAAFHQLEKFEQRADGETVRLNDEWTERHKAFHMALLAAAPSQRLLASCGSLFDQAERYRRLSAMKRKFPRNGNDEHRKMLEAVIERREELARALLKEHIVQTTRNVLLTDSDQAA